MEERQINLVYIQQATFWQKSPRLGLLRYKGCGANIWPAAAINIKIASFKECGGKIFSCVSFPYNDY